MAGYYDYLRRLTDEWAEKEGLESIEVEPFTDYAIANKLIPRQPLTLKQQTMRDVRKALQSSTYIDQQGNKVRAKHALKVYQMELPNMPPRIEYIDPRTAKPDKMELAMDQSHEGMKNDVKRHAIEKQSYDLNNPYNAKLRDYDYDFNMVAEDARMSGEYSDDYDDEDFDGDWD